MDHDKPAAILGQAASWLPLLRTPAKSHHYRVRERRTDSATARGTKGRICRRKGPAGARRKRALVCSWLELWVLFNQYRFATEFFPYPHAENDAACYGPSSLYGLIPVLLRYVLVESVDERHSGQCLKLALKFPSIVGSRSNQLLLFFQQLDNLGFSFTELNRTAHPDSQQRSHCSSVGFVVSSLRFPLHLHRLGRPTAQMPAGQAPRCFR